MNDDVVRWWRHGMVIQLFLVAWLGMVKVLIVCLTQEDDDAEEDTTLSLQ